MIIATAHRHRYAIAPPACCAHTDVPDSKGEKAVPRPGQFNTLSVDGDASSELVPTPGQDVTLAAQPLDHH